MSEAGLAFIMIITLGVAISSVCLNILLALKMAGIAERNERVEGYMRAAIKNRRRRI